ncbi:LOW QUALITY PROTEIN: hypothetical protein HID58_020345, partial [Brassica napus]
SSTTIELLHRCIQLQDKNTKPQKKKQNKENSMDITRNSNTKLHLQTQSLFPPNMEKTVDVEPRMDTNPFAEDSLTSRINPNKNADLSSSSSSSDMVNERRQSFSSQKSIGEGRSSGQRRVMLMESPCTPGRGVFSFSSNVSGRRRNFPSKWVDAEKWVTSGHESPAHSLKVVYSEKSRVTEEKVSLSPPGLILKVSKRSAPINGRVIFRDSDKFLQFQEEEEAQVQHRDMGTEMTPAGSVTASRCHTPFKSMSPARHNTPSKMSGPLTETKNVIDISEFADKLRLSGSAATQYYNSGREEEEEISKSLRQMDMESELRRSVSESKAVLWDGQDDKIKFCQRYQREEAKIQAWVNLQNAKAEAQSRKLEMKIQKMRSNFEEKLMKRMDTVHRRAEDWRATTRQQHAEQLHRAAETARKLTNRRGYLLGSTAIGVKTKEGVVLAVEKRITSPLLEPSSVEKIMEIDDHIGCAMSGLIADARTLVEHARVETQNHRFSYGEPMTVESTTQALCDLALRFGEGDEESMSRPFGVSLLIAGHDENGPSLYYTDPSGTFWQCNAKAIGSGSEGADSSLQEQFNKDLSLSEAETIAVSILKQVMEEKVTPNNVDIAKVAPAYHLYTPQEVEAVISRL